MKRILFLLSLIFILICLSCASSNSTSSELFFPSNFMKGIDISMVNQLENQGGEFYTSAGTKKDIYSILKESGANWIRVRLWVNPDQYERGNLPYPQGMNNLAAVKKMIQDSKAKEMKVLLDFHYSDTWAHPGQQYIPLDWKNISLGKEMADKLASYTTDVLQNLIDSGCTPDMVQVGNEVTDGILSDTEYNMEHLNLYLQAGCNAVKAVDENILVMIHIDRGGNKALVQNWFAKYAKNCDYDVIGLSWYPFYNSHGTLQGLQENIAYLKSTTGKQVVTVETSYPWTEEWKDNSPNSVGNDNLYAAYWQLKNQGKTPKGIKIKTDSSGAKYIPATIPNQEAVFKAVIEATIQGGGSGVFYWGGEWISVNKDDYGSMGSSWENQALFDFEGKALPALELYSLETK
mgnify:CR=1 FL=1